MKLALIVLVPLILVGCSGELAQPAPTTPSLPAPTPPAPTPAPTAFLAGMVIGEGGGCIAGATVEVVRGQRLGESITQTLRCSWWDWEDSFEFRDLTPGVEMTLRGSAPGFDVREGTFLPSLRRDSRPIKPS